jgi:hypothetical protein
MSGFCHAGAEPRAIFGDRQGSEVGIADPLKACRRHRLACEIRNKAAHLANAAFAIQNAKALCARPAKSNQFHNLS